MTGEPLVSVLTPSLSQARWLGDALGSVARQTYPRIEQIVMDGGSTDGSVALLRAASPRVRWRSEPDRGQSHALNKAFAESEGEIIGWLNADDAYFAPDTVSEVTQLFARRPDVAVVYGHAALVNGDGLILHMIWAPPFNAPLLRLHNFIIQPTAFIRRSALGATLVDEAYESAMDRELWLRLDHRCRFARLDRVLAIDRHHPGRKVYTRPDLARAEGERLVAAYGVPSGDWSRAKLKVCKIAFRLAGLRLVPQASRTPLAFDGRVDGVWRLARRQLAAPRATMPVGSASLPYPERATP